VVGDTRGIGPQELDVVGSGQANAVAPKSRLSVRNAIVRPVTTTPSEPADIETEARRLRQQMVDTMRANGWITSDRVAAAMNRVPREDFAPDTDLQTVYQAESVVRFGFDANGVCVTSISAPRCQAEMLEFAHVQVGDTVLEVGSGGVNAAYLAELTGPGGHVVSVDIDPEVTDRASRCLDRAGYSRVRVALADAEYGMPEHAPYDTVLVTAGVWDIPGMARPNGGARQACRPAAIPGAHPGRGVHSGRPAAVEHRPRDVWLRSLRGEGQHSGLIVSAGSGMNLAFDEDEPAEPQVLAGVLNGPRSPTATTTCTTISPNARTRVVIAVGEESEGTLTARTSTAAAELLGRQAAVFPSHHGGFTGGEFGYAGKPEEFAHRLREVLDGAS
jgi:protein-L-isoaspartate(D-aspartate) O-methyltransferase